MPTSLKGLLNSYSEQELEKIAKDKIEDFEHLRLPKSVLVEELANILTSPSYIFDCIAFRSPPAFEIFSVLLNSEGYEHPIQGFRKAVLEETKKHIKKAQAGDFLEKGKGYNLYTKVLGTAWKTDSSIDRSEAYLLESLREELGITFQEHCILEHRSEIREYWDEGNPFQRERNKLLQLGIIFANEEHYILPEEIAYQILTLWGIELDNYDYQRLLACLTKKSLSLVLEQYEIKVSGIKKELINRIIKNHIPASKVLSKIPKEELSDVCKKINCKSSGLKREIIDRLIKIFRYDRDLIVEEEDEKEEIIEEEKELTEQKFRRLFKLFTSSELQHLLAQVPTLVTYGRKEKKIDRLWIGPYSERTLLDLLTKREIKEACNELNLFVSGRKEELINRLLDHFRALADDNSGIEEERETDKYQKQTEKKMDPEENRQSEPSEIPQLDQVKTQFQFLDYNQQVILASLIEFKSLNEQEIDRIVARYDLSWMFYKPEMNQLINELKDHGSDLIEKHSFGESDRYDLRYEQNIFR